MQNQKAPGVQQKPDTADKKKTDPTTEDLKCNTLIFLMLFLYIHTYIKM